MTTDAATNPDATSDTTEPTRTPRGTATDLALIAAFAALIAALTYLGSLVEGITPDLKYALVAGAVTGGGLTVIANAPNPAGVGILQTSEAFQGEGISPLGLFLGALPPTLVAVVFFWIVA